MGKKAFLNRSSGIALLWVCSAFFFLFGQASPANALSLRMHSLESLRKEALSIRHAQCISTYAARDEHSGNVYRYAKFETMEVLKGGLTVPQQFFLRTLERVGASKALALPGAPAFSAGSQYVLYLREHNADGFPMLVGFTQGALPLSKDALGHMIIDVRTLGPAFAHMNIPRDLNFAEFKSRFLAPSLDERLGR